MKIHQFTAEEAFRSLQSSPGGLSQGEAERRLAGYGPNLVESVSHLPIWWRLLKALGHFFAIVLWIGAVLVFVAEAQHPGQGMATLGATIVGVSIVNAIFSFWQ